MLQCYALRRAIQNKGYDAVVLNYISDKQYDNNSVYRRKQGVKGYIKNALLFPFNDRRKKRQRSFESFRKEYLGCTQPRICKQNDLQSYITQNGFDVIISGSDQVWNPNVFDFDDVFFYPFCVNARKIGYAVSLGAASVGQLEPYKRWIDDFDAITVRESKSCNVIKKLTEKEVSSVVDPVLLLSQDSWRELVPSRKTNYLLCYFVREEDLREKIEKAKELACKLNLEVEIVNLRITKYNFFERILFDLSPIEFLTELANAEYIYTDSFHGTVFSMIFERNFTTVVSKSEGEDNRKSNILSVVGLEKRIKSIDNSSDLMEVIEYKDVRKKIDVIRDQSNQVLIDLLTNSKDGESI